MTKPTEGRIVHVKYNNLCYAAVIVDIASAADDQVYVHIFPTPTRLAVPMPIHGWVSMEGDISWHWPERE